MVASSWFIYSTLPKRESFDVETTFVRPPSILPCVCELKAYTKPSFGNS